MLSNKSIVKICVSNVKPILETRKIRKFRDSQKIPLVAPLPRQEGKAIYWLTRFFSEKSLIASLKNLNVLGNENYNINQFSFLINKCVYNEINAQANSDLKKKRGNNNFSHVRFLKHRFYKKLKVDKNIPSLDDEIKFPVKYSMNNKSESFTYVSYLKKFYIFTEKNEFKIIEKLSEQLDYAFCKKVEIVEKRKKLHQDALKNRAYLKYRWW